MIDAIRVSAGGRGRHAAGGNAAIPVSVFLSPAAPQCPRRRHEPVLRPSTNAALALGIVGAVGLTTLAAPPVARAPMHVATTSHADVRLAGVVQPSDVIALVGALDGAMASASATVATLIAIPGQTAADALKAAAFVNNVFFELLTLASPNAVLTAALNGLKSVSVNGLSRLANTVWSLNSDMVLTAKQMSTLLTTALTGSLGTVIGAVADLLNNPLSLPRYAGLADAPLNVAGLALSSGITALNDLGVNAFSAGNAVVTGVLSQIKTVIDGVNGLFAVGHALIPNAVVDGLLTAVHGIVMSPLNAVVNGAIGLSAAITNVGADLVSAVADTAAADVHLWLGDGLSAGALQTAINSVAVAPLSITGYATAVSTLVTAAIATVTTTVGVGAGKLAAIPFTLAGDLTTAGASAMNAFISGTANVVAGLLQVVGVPSLLYNVSYGVAQVAIWINNHLASGIKYELDNFAAHVAAVLGASAAASTTQTATAAVTSTSSSGKSTAAKTVSAATVSATASASASEVKKSTETAQAASKPVAVSVVNVPAKDGSKSSGADDSGDNTTTTDSSTSADDGAAAGTSKTPHKSGKTGKNGRLGAGSNSSVSRTDAASSSPATSSSSGRSSAQSGRHHKS